MEQTALGSSTTFVQKEDEKVYRLTSWKIGCSYAGNLKTMETVSTETDKTNLIVSYETPFEKGELSKVILQL